MNSVSHATSCSNLWGLDSRKSNYYCRIQIKGRMPLDPFPAKNPTSSKASGRTVPG